MSQFKWKKTKWDYIMVYGSFIMFALIAFGYAMRACGQWKGF